MGHTAVTPGRLRKVGGVEGIDEIKAAIAGKLTKMEGRGAKQVFMRASLKLVRDARDMAPIYEGPSRPDVHPGQLRGAIFASYGKPEKPNVLVGVNPTKAPHFHWEEYGTGRFAEHIHKKGTGVLGARAQPYMRPALKAMQNIMAMDIAEGLRDLVQK